MASEPLSRSACPSHGAHLVKKKKKRILWEALASLAFPSVGHLQSKFPNNWGALLGSRTELPNRSIMGATNIIHMYTYICIVYKLKCSSSTFKK